jgi:hypothetical protein
MTVNIIEPMFVGMLLHRDGGTVRILPSMFEGTGSPIPDKTTKKTLKGVGCYVYTSSASEAISVIKVDESEQEVWEIYANSMLRLRTLTEETDTDVTLEEDEIEGIGAT